ncbi:hypothetical protein [Virgibacillus proomii]|uniref:hypothetical protein n=1 Tax=Virgibacillus proomii TaxID=84407 RepID=UPI00118003B0|nr:hypothetical protein [Virgibacillus proomii]
MRIDTKPSFLAKLLRYLTFVGAVAARSDIRLSYIVTAGCISSILELVSSAETGALPSMNGINNTPKIT